MIDYLLDRGILAALSNLFRLRRPAHAPRPEAITAALDEATEAERARYAAWSAEHGLASADGLVFTGRIDGRRVELESGCAGSAPRGPALEFAVSGLADEPLLVTESNADAHPMGALFDDLALSGSLRSIAVTASSVRLRLAPGRSTEVLDAAVRALREILYAPPARPRSDNAYR